jgi:hypothetical protein
MPAIPAHLMHFEVVFEPAELLAHWLGPSGPAPDAPEPQRDSRGHLLPSRTARPADRYAPKCRPEEPPTFHAMSARRADELEAEACEADVCFGRELAAGPPTSVRLVAVAPKPSKARRVPRRLAAAK